MAAHVVVFKPRGAPANWVRTGVWDRAAAIPGVTLWIDEGGKLTQLFGAETSGQVLLYELLARSDSKEGSRRPAVMKVTTWGELLCQA